ncbi:MAG: hypothetical protein M3453_10945 [Pseudomonadota bacterium]|nr:hypothetical protein [Pseudomonadota bacterium]
MESDAAEQGFIAALSRILLTDEGPLGVSDGVWENVVSGAFTDLLSLLIFGLFTVLIFRRVERKRWQLPRLIFFTDFSQDISLSISMYTHWLVAMVIAHPQAG